MTDITERLRRLYVQHGTDYVQAAADEIERLRAELAKADGQINRCVEQNKYLESTISRLREYARHTPACYWWSGTINQPHPCDCGYDALMAEVEGTK